MRGSAVALTTRTNARISTGRTPLGGTLVKNAEIEIVVFPTMGASPYDPLNRVFADSITTSTKELEHFSEMFKKHVAHGGMIAYHGDPINGIDVKKLSSITGTARGYDPDARDADGDMLVQEGTPWQRMGTRIRRAVKKGKRRLAAAADSTAERIEDRVDKRTSRRGERGKIRRGLANIAETAANRIDGGDTAPRPKKKRRIRNAIEDYTGLTAGEGSRDKPEADRPKEPKIKPDEPKVQLDDDGKPETPSPAKPLPSDDDDEWAKAYDKWKKKPSSATEDVTVDATAESKMPGKKYGTGTKDRDVALLGARDASKKNKDKTLHVVKGSDGKYRVVDEERMEAMGGKPVAAYKDGKMTMRDGAPVKKRKDSTTYEKIDSTDGWSGGGKFSSEELAVQQASNIKNTVYPGIDFGPDDNIHVVRTEAGMFTFVDDEKLQALGIDPVASFTGDGKEVPWGATDPKPKKPKPKSNPKPIGEIPGEEPMPTLTEVEPDPKVTVDAKKKKPKVGGKQFGRPSKSQKTAIKKANELAAADGGTYHVWGDENGFRVVDQERLDALGATSLHTGGDKEFKPGPNSNKPSEPKVEEKEPVEDKKKTGPSSFESMAGFKKEFDDIKKSFDDGAIEDSQVNDLADISNVLEELVAISDDPTEKNVASQFALEVSSLYAKVTKDKKKTPEKKPTEPVATTTGADDLKEELDALNNVFFKATAPGDSKELQEEFINGIASLQKKISSYPDGPEKEELLDLVKQAKNKFKKWQDGKPTGKVLTKSRNGFLTMRILDLEQMLKEPKSEWTDEDEKKFSEGFIALQKEIGFSGGHTSPYEFSSNLTYLRARLFMLVGAKEGAKPKKQSKPKKIEKTDVLEKLYADGLGAVSQSEYYNDTAAGITGNDADHSAQTEIHREAIKILESLSQEERNVLGTDYSDMLAGAKNNLAIWELAGEKHNNDITAALAEWSKNPDNNFFNKPSNQVETSVDKPAMYQGIDDADITDVLESAMAFSGTKAEAKERYKAMRKELDDVAESFTGGKEGQFEGLGGNELVEALTVWAANADTSTEQAVADMLIKLAKDGVIDGQTDKKDIQYIAKKYTSIAKDKLSKMPAPKKVPKKPLGKDDNPMYYNSDTGMVIDPAKMIDDLFDKVQGVIEMDEDPDDDSLSINDEVIEQATEKFDDIAKELHEFSDDMKPGGKYEGLNKYALMDALAEAVMGNTSVEQGEAAEILIDLFEQGFFGDKPTSKELNQVSKTFAMAAKKKLAAMKKQFAKEDSDAINALNPTTADDNSGENLQITEDDSLTEEIQKNLTKLLELIESGDDHYDETMGKLWEMYNLASDYISDLANESEDPDQKEKIKDAQSLMSSIYSTIEDLSMSMDDEKLQDQAVEYAETMGDLTALLKLHKDKKAEEWSKPVLDDFLSKLNALEATMAMLDENSIYGDEPWDLIGDLNDIVTSAKEAVDDLDETYDDEFDMIVKKQGSKEMIEAHYAQQLQKINESLQAGIIGKAEAETYKKKLYQEKAKAELSLPAKSVDPKDRPFKTSREIDENVLGDLQNMIMQDELSKAKDNLAEYLLTEGLIPSDLAGDPVEVELEDGTKKQILKPKEGVSDLDIRKSIMEGLIKAITNGESVGDVASLRTHLHNWDVLANFGSYSVDVSALTPTDRFNHLGPSAQKGVLKSLYEQFDKDELDKEFKKAKKKQAKTQVADDIESVTTKPKKKKTKITTPNASLLNTSYAEAKEKGLDVWDELLEAAPEGAILQVVHSVAALEGTDDKPFKGVDAELTYLQGSDVGYWINPLFFGSGPEGQWLEEKLPTAYKYPAGPDDDADGEYLKPGEKGGLIGGRTIKGDYSPDSGSVLDGNVAASFGNAKSFLKSEGIDDWTNPKWSEVVSSAEKNGLPNMGTNPEEFKYLQSALRNKFGITGGYLVSDDKGFLHFIPRQQWRKLPTEVQDNLTVQIAVPKEWETWSGGLYASENLSKSSVFGLPVGWESLSLGDQREMVTALLVQEGMSSEFQLNSYNLKASGLVDDVEQLAYTNIGATMDSSVAEEALKSWVSGISENPEHPLHDTSFGLYSLTVGAPGQQQVIALRLNEKISKGLADKHPTLFKKLGTYDGSGNWADDFGGDVFSVEGSILNALNDKDDFSWAQGDGVDQAQIFLTGQQWIEKLATSSGHLGSVDGELKKADDRLDGLQMQFDKILNGKSVADLGPEEIKALFEADGTDFDSFITKLKNTAVRRMATKAMIVANTAALKDENEAVAEVNKKLLSGEYTKPGDLSGDLKNVKTMAGEASDRMAEITERMIELSTGAEGNTTETIQILFNDYAAAKAQLKAWTNAAERIQTIADDLKDVAYKGKKPLNIGGEEYLPSAGSVFIENAPNIQTAVSVASSVSQVLKPGQQMGLFNLDSGEYAIVEMQSALDANLPAPNMIFNSNGVVAPMEADPTEVMDILTSAGTPKVKDGYAGIENLGVSSDNGVAIGKFVESGLSANATPEQVAAAVAKWNDHIAQGGSLADVPNDLLLDAVWSNREGNGSGRFKFLTKASGYNDSVSDPKMRTHRFLDTATGHVFVLKSASRNDQEGIRELFGNQVMQSLGFPSSGGRTASLVFTAPNKYAEYNHPEANDATPQMSVLLESSEMLYDGKNLGHVRSMQPSDRADVISRLSPESVANGVVMDSLFRYYDRQGDNWIAIENEDGSVAYHPIDHGNAFGLFKGKKFADKDGKRINDNSPAYEDKLGFMFVGLDGEGTWKLAKESMNTPERKQRFAEAVLRAVHRAETADFESDAESLISAQNLNGAHADRVTKSAKLLEEKKKRIASYVDPMLKELGMSDEEISAARSTIQGEVSSGFLKAGKATKPVAAPGQNKSFMVNSSPNEGEEAFGNSPALPGAKTVTEALETSVEKPGLLSYVSVGGGQVKGGVRFESIGSTGVPTGTQPTTVMTFTIDADSSLGITKSLTAGIDGAGNPVEVMSTGLGTVTLKTDNGIFITPPTGDFASLDPADQASSYKIMDVQKGYQEKGNKYAVAKTVEGHIIISSTGQEGYAFSIGDTVQVLLKPNEDGTPHTPAQVEDIMRRVGIKNTAYTGDDDWKMQAAELLVRTYDGLHRDKIRDSLGVRLGRVMSKHGLSVNDVEPYFDSIGRMRFRLKDEAWEKIKSNNPGLTNAGTYIIKTMNNYQSEDNVIRVIDGNGVLSKAEQVKGGYGAFGGTAAGGGGHGASASADLESGGGKGVFMTPMSSTGQHQNAWSSRGTDIVFDGEEMMRDIGWWAHGPTDGPFGVINPESNKTGNVNNSETSIGNMVNKKTFEFLPDSAADLSKVKAVILKDGYSSQRRAKLIAHYKDKGIDEINGIPLEEFFVATPTQIRNALPKFNGTSFHGSKLASKKDALNALSGTTSSMDAPMPSMQGVDPKTGDGFTGMALQMIQGKSSNTTYFPDGKLTKTQSFGTAVARAKKYSKALPGEKLYMFRDTNGNWRVSTEKFYSFVAKQPPQYPFVEGISHIVINGVVTKYLEGGTPTP